MTVSLHMNHIEINIVYMGVCQKMVSHRVAYCIYIVGPCSYSIYCRLGHSLGYKLQLGVCSSVS